MFFYETPVWYRRTFDYHKPPDTRVFVYFGAANYHTRVYLNGEKLGEHEGGFTPFNFEVTDHLRDGNNDLVVEVTDTRTAESVPALRYDWWNYGGITGDVELVEVPKTFIQDYLVQLAKGSSDEIAGWVQLNGASSPQSVSLEIPEAGIHREVTTDASGRAEFRFPAKLQLWSPEQPKLYDVAIASGADKLHDQIGFRSIEMQGGKILLNGKPIFLRGIDLHDESPFRGGRLFRVKMHRLCWPGRKIWGATSSVWRTTRTTKPKFASPTAWELWCGRKFPVWQDINCANPATLQMPRTSFRK